MMATASVVPPLPSSPASTSSPIPQSRRSKKSQQSTTQRKTSSKKRTKQESEWSAEALGSPSCSSDVTHPGESVQDSAESHHPSTSKKRKKQVKQACAGCKKAHTRCEEARPCPRCRTLGVECVDAPRKKRKRRDDQNSDELDSNNSDSSSAAHSDLNSSSSSPAPNHSFSNQRVHRTEGVDGGEEVKVNRRKRKPISQSSSSTATTTVTGTKRKTLNTSDNTQSGKKSKLNNSNNRNLKTEDEDYDNLHRSLDQDQEGGDASYNSSPSSSPSNEDFGDPTSEIQTGDDFGGVYIYHQHHHLLYQDQFVQTVNSANNNIQNNIYDWESYYESSPNPYGSNLRASDTTLAGLYYGIINPALNLNSLNSAGYYYNNTNGSVNNSWAMLTDNQEHYTKTSYHQSEDLQRIRENYLKDWLC